MAQTGPKKPFQDRQDAGRQLALRLRDYGAESPLVLGLPQGGVSVAYEVARALGAPLDVCVAREIGAPPLRPELGIGAVAESGTVWIDDQTRRLVQVSDEELARSVDEVRAEVDERARLYRDGAPPLDVHDRTVLLVADGLVTGRSARAALRTLRARGAGRTVLAVAVAASAVLDDLGTEVDDIVCLHAAEPLDLDAIAASFEDFTPVTDDTVRELLERSRAELARAPQPRMRSERVLARPSVTREVRIPFDDAWLGGVLMLPPMPSGLVLFAHGTAGGRFDKHDRYVADELARAGLATLLFDLLTEHENRIDKRTTQLRFDVDLLADRFLLAAEWAGARPETKDLPIGFFGASTAAPAALLAAARRPDLVRAVATRGGRPDAADAALGDVKAPCLLIAGGADRRMLKLAREASDRLRCEKAIEIVPEATYVFEEPGALEHVAQATVRWMSRFLGGARRLEATA